LEVGGWGLEVGGSYLFKHAFQFGCCERTFALAVQIKINNLLHIHYKT